MGGDRCTRGVRKTKIENCLRYRRNAAKHGNEGEILIAIFSFQNRLRGAPVEKWRETVDEETATIALI